MSDFKSFGDNPYDSPTPSTSWGDGTGDNHGTVEALRQTRPWVLFLAILGFIGSGLMILGGLCSGIALARLAGPGGVIMMILYVGLGVVYLMPAVFLFRYGSRIGDYLRNRSETSLNAALNSQMSFWRLVGIMTIVMILLYIGLIVLMTVASVNLAPRFR
jgi:hypothetical protein